MRWPKNLDEKIRLRVKLAGYTTFKIGGPARFFFEPDSLKELLEALAFAKNKGIPVVILGAGSNILVSDSGLDGLVIKLSGRDFKLLRINGVYMQAGCGLKLNQLLIGAKNKSLSGFEFLAGIPGTLGGALMGNAGARGKSIGDLVEELRVLDYNGKIKLLKKDQLKFSYRKSNLHKYIIVSAKLKLAPGKQDEIALLISQFLRQRARTQENNLPNAGCIFKNPTKAVAGKLIEACGLKSKAAGGAVISKVHANFILNRGRAKSKDVLSLMHLMRDEVKRRFKVNLEPEIILWK
ncbi:UDP-N-acetylmuramate dehydrogenase [bacterium]|nr:MAG: UDP-N-acetylmuramate dehydrogenase [bacterium]